MRGRTYDCGSKLGYLVANIKFGLDHDAVKVLRRLARNGHEAYLVGGGVRDLLLGRSPKDFDVATDARPQDVRRIFRNCRVIGRRTWPHWGLHLYIPSLRDE